MLNVMYENGDSREQLGSTGQRTVDHPVPGRDADVVINTPPLPCPARARIARP